MKANAPKPERFLMMPIDVLCGEDTAVLVNGIEMLPIDSVHPFSPKHCMRGAVR